MNDRIFCLGLGHLGMLFFVFLSVFYYQERLLVIDSAYYSYNILHNESFFIPHYRYINYLVQWLPLLMMNLGVGLKGVLISYSLAMALLYYAIFYIIAYIIRNHIAALFMVIALVLSSRFVHYLSVTETMSTMALSFLFIGWVTRDEYLQNTAMPSQWSVAFLCLMVLLLGHPIIFLPLLGFVAMYLFYHNKLKDPYAWLLVFFVLFVMLIRYKVMPSSGYEQNKMKAFAKSSEILSNFTNQWTYDHLIHYTLEHFKYGLLAYGLCLFALVYMKKYWSALVSLGTLFCFIVVIVIIYHGGESIAMLENYYAYFGFFWSVAMIFVFKDLGTKYYLKYVVVSFVLLVSIRSIFLHGKFFTDRLQYMYGLTEVAKDKGMNRTLFPKTKMNYEQVIVPWAASFSTLIYSTLKSSDDVRTLYFYEDNELSKIDTTSTSEFLGATFNLHQFEAKDIPVKYFDFNDTKYYLVK